MRENMTRRTRARMSAAILVLGVMLAAAGVYLGQHTDVWRKAIFICMECIGLG